MSKKTSISKALDMYQGCPCLCNLNCNSGYQLYNSNVPIKHYLFTIKYNKNAIDK